MSVEKKKMVYKIKLNKRKKHLRERTSARSWFSRNW